MLKPEALADPKAYTKPDEILELYRYLRSDEPLVRVEPKGYRPFYAVTRAADIRAIETDSATFEAGPRSVLLPEKVEDHYRRSIGDPNGVRPLTHMDGTYHRSHRAVTMDWFKPGLLKSFRPRLEAKAKAYVDRMAGSGGSIDFASEIAYWYPLEVVLELMGVPDEDYPFLLRLTQRLLSPADAAGDEPVDSTSLSPAARTVFGKHGNNAAAEFAAYFAILTKDRQTSPREDIISTIANAEVFGGEMAVHEMTSYFIILATAGHDSTAASLSAGLEALIQNPDQMAKLRADPSLMSSAAEECVRWSSPVKHFMRTPNKQVELHGHCIEAGEAIMLCFASASRDPDLFPDADRFLIDRPKVASHLGFGFGPHLCLGRLLAKLEIECLLSELLSRVDNIELAGNPTFVASTFVTGHKTLPITYTMR